ncbi:MAG: type II toxin-antitoxin system VapC family toxin [Longimicrobiaceae bacterium]
MIFIDTSAIIKAYVTEQGTPTVEKVIAHLKGRLYLTPAVVLEVLGALAKCRRAGVLTQREYRTARNAFLQAVGVTFKLLELHEAEFTAAYSLVDRFRQFRAGSWDALHVASALRLNAISPRHPVPVASADGGMLGLARAAGLPTFNPELEPLSALLALTK